MNKRDQLFAKRSRLLREADMVREIVDRVDYQLLSIDSIERLIIDLEARVKWLHYRSLHI